MTQPDEAAELAAIVAAINQAFVDLKARTRQQLIKQIQDELNAAIVSKDYTAEVQAYKTRVDAVLVKLEKVLQS